MTQKKSKPSPRWSIDALTIIQALQLHVTGEKNMKPSQIKIALTLLEKRLPDVAAKPAKKRSSRRQRDDVEGTLKDLA